MVQTYLLFAVYGVSGAGKSTLLEAIEKVSPGATIHRKYSTRKRRPKEAANNIPDLELVKEIPKDSCVVVYRKYRNYYGIRRDLLEQAYRNKEVHFIVIRDIQALRQLKSIHQELKIIYIHSDPDKIRRNLQKREGLKITERKRRVREEFLEYVDHNTLFDHVVVNFWELENALKQLQHIVALHRKRANDVLA